VYGRVTSLPAEGTAAEETAREVDDVPPTTLAEVVNAPVTFSI